MANSIGLTMLGHYKLTKKRGGRKGLKAMESGFIKKNEGKTVTAEEQKQVDAFEAYKMDLKLLNGEVTFSDSQREMLIKAAMPMCEDNKMKINTHAAFWTLLLGAETTKIYKVLTL